MLRFLFTVAVLLHHSRFAFSGETRYFEGGWIGVEFFFIVSGYLMAAYEDRLPAFSGKDANGELLAQDSFSFVKRKLAGLLPYYTFAALAGFIVWSLPLPEQFSIVPIAKKGITVLWNFVFPYSAGFPDKYYEYLGYSWYISALIWGSMILFPLLRRNRKTFVYILAPLITIFGLGTYAYLFGTLGMVSEDYYLLSSGIIRGLAELSLGCICYSCSQKLKAIRFTKAGSTILSAIEVLGISIIAIWITFKGGGQGISSFMLLFLIAACVTLAFSGKSGTAFLLPEKTSILSGKFCYALYINSNAWSYFTARMFPKLSYLQFTAVYISLAVLATLICMLVCRRIGIIWNNNKVRWKRAVLDD